MFSIVTQVMSGYETRTKQNSEPRLPVAYAGLRDHQRLDLYRDS